MKNLALALAVFLLTSTAQASSANKKFVSFDNTAASNLCVIAAESGYSAAVDNASLYGEENINSMICNGKTIEEFSKTFKIKETSAKEIKVVPANNSFESNLCVEAVKNGLKAVTSSTDVDVSQTICNGQQIAHFVKRYSNF